VSKTFYGLDELLTTIICFGHFWEGGLNFSVAGRQTGSKSDRTSVAYQQGHIQNQQSILTSDLQLRNMKEASVRIRDTTELLDLAQQNQTGLQSAKLASLKIGLQDIVATIKVQLAGEQAAEFRC